MKQEKYQLIDFLKFIFSIFIVGLHTNITNNYYIIQSLFRLAVPFFFVVSGYFFYNSINKNFDIKKYINKLIPPLITWSTIGIIFEGISAYIKGKSLIYIIVNSIRNFLFYPNGAMWYVLALIISAILISYLKKHHQKTKYFIIIAFIGYIFALLCNNYFFLVENTIFEKIILIYMKVFVSARNGFLVGFPLFSLGYLINKHKTNEKLKIKKSIILFLITYICLIIEIIILKEKSFLDDRALYILSPLVSSSLLILCLNSNIKFKTDTKKFRDLSRGIYFTHSFINYLCLSIKYIFALEINKYIYFLIVISLSIIISTIFRNSKIKFLKQIV